MPTVPVAGKKGPIVKKRIGSKMRGAAAGRSRSVTGRAATSKRATVSWEDLTMRTLFYTAAELANRPADVEDD